VAFHKPRRVVVSRVRQGGAATVFELLPREFQGWFAVGRLDKDSEGLLLFCNDSRLAQRLMDPGGVPKTYLVTVGGYPRDEDLAPIRSGGLMVAGRPSLPAEVCHVGRAPRGGTRFEVVLREGRNREIRRLFFAAGFKVRRLVRTSVGPVSLGDLPSGETRELDPEMVTTLRGLADS